MLPAKMDIIADNHKDNGCFLENVIAPEMIYHSLLRVSKQVFDGKISKKSVNAILKNFFVKICWGHPEHLFSAPTRYIIQLESIALTSMSWLWTMQTLGSISASIAWIRNFAVFTYRSVKIFKVYIF